MTQINNSLSIQLATQSVASSNTNTTSLQTAASTSSADYLAEVITDLVIGLEAHAKATSGSSSASVLSATAEPQDGSAATSTASVDPTALTSLGSAVGAGMASAGTEMDWSTFAQQSQQTLSAAGYSAADIDTYLGAVMLGYAEASQSSGSASPSTGHSGIHTPGIAINAGSTGSAASTGVTASTASPVSTTVATSTSTYAVATSQLPSLSTNLGQFTALAESAYNAAAASLGSSVDINTYVANTQSEMQNAGYSQEQINNYMTGLYIAHNASLASQSTNASSTSAS